MNRVQGKEHLFKDPNSGAVVNDDQDSFNSAKMYKKRILEERQKQQTLEERIDSLERLVEKLASK